MWFVVNFSRPLTPDANAAYEIMREIEHAADLPFTGIINNTNIGNETTRETVLASREKAEELAKIANLPLVMTTVTQSLAPSFSETELTAMFPLQLQPKYFDIGRSSIWQN